MQTRQCIVTGERLPAPRLLRFVAGAEQWAVADAAGRLPGRGCWLTPHPWVMQEALAKRLLQKRSKGRMRPKDTLIADAWAVLWSEAKPLIRQAGFQRCWEQDGPIAWPAPLEANVAALLGWKAPPRHLRLEGAPKRLLPALERLFFWHLPEVPKGPEAMVSLVFTAK